MVSQFKLLVLFCTVSFASFGQKHVLYEKCAEINLNIINITDTSTTFHYYDRDSVIFEKRQLLNDSLNLYFITDSLGFKKYIQINDVKYDINKMRYVGLAPFNKDYLNELEINSGCFVKNKNGNKDFLVLFGKFEPCVGRTFVRLVFVFERNKCFFYQTIDNIENESMPCTGCFTSENNTVGFTEWMHYKGFYITHMVEGNQITSQRKLLGKKFKLNLW